MTEPGDWARGTTLEHEPSIQRWVKTAWPRVKNAARLNAWLVFLDECGILMAPLVRRSWSPCGHTPVLYQRTRAHRKVSVSPPCASRRPATACTYFSDEAFGSGSSGCCSTVFEFRGQRDMSIAMVCG